MVHDFCDAFLRNRRPSNSLDAIDTHTHTHTHLHGLFQLSDVDNHPSHRVNLSDRIGLAVLGGGAIY